MTKENERARVTAREQHAHSKIISALAGRPMRNSELLEAIGMALPMSQRRLAEDQIRGLVRTGAIRIGPTSEMTLVRCGTDKMPAEKAREGWRCSREFHHEGPCAAHPPGAAAGAVKQRCAACGGSGNLDGQAAEGHGWPLPPPCPACQGTTRPAFAQCPMTCPHGDRCSRVAGHLDDPSIGGCRMACACNEPNIARASVREEQAFLERVGDEPRCWCGAATDGPVDFKRWCHEHAPRCRSGAHFWGNCLCAGMGIT